MPQRLAQHLLNRGLVTAAAVDEALRRVESQGGSLDTALLELGVISEAGVLQAVSDVSGVRLVNLADFEPNSAAGPLMPFKMARQLLVAPLSLDGNALHLACAYPIPQAQLKDVGFLLGRTLELWVSLECRIRDWQASLYGAPLERRYANLLRSLDPNRPTATPPPANKPDDGTIVGLEAESLSPEVLERIARGIVEEPVLLQAPKKAARSLEAVPATEAEESSTTVVDATAYARFAKSESRAAAAAKPESTRVLDRTQYQNFARATAEPPAAPADPDITDVVRFPGGVLPPRTSAPEPPKATRSHEEPTAWVRPAAAGRPSDPEEMPRPRPSAGLMTANAKFDTEAQPAPPPEPPRASAVPPPPPSRSTVATPMSPASAAAAPSRPSTPSQATMMTPAPSAGAAPRSASTPTEVRGSSPSQLTAATGRASSPSQATTSTAAATSQVRASSPSQAAMPSGGATSPRTSSPSQAGATPARTSSPSQVSGAAGVAAQAAASTASRESSIAAAAPTAPAREPPPTAPPAPIDETDFSDVAEAVVRPSTPVPNVPPEPTPVALSRPPATRRSAEPALDTPASAPGAVAALAPVMPDALPAGMYGGDLSAPILGAPPGLAPASATEWTLAQARASLKEASTDRDALVTVMLEYGRRAFEFVCAFAVMRGAAYGWDLRGDGDAAALRAMAIPLDTASVFRTVALTRGSYVGPMPVDALSHHYLAQLGRTPRTVFVWPVEVQSKLVAVIYGDCGARPVSQRRLADFILFCQDLPSAFHELIAFRKLNPRAPAMPEASPSADPSAEPPTDADWFYGLLSLLTGPDASERTMAMVELLKTPEASARALAAAFPGPTGWSRMPVVDLPEPDELGPIPGAIARLGPAGANALAPLLDSNDSDARYLALLTAGSLRYPDVVDGVLRGLFDLEPDISSAARAAAASLTYVPEFQVRLPDVRQELAAADPLRRSLAARALGVLHDREAIDGLINLTGSEDSLCATSAAEALRELTRASFGTNPRAWSAWWAGARGKRRVEWLVEALSSPEFDERLATIEELSRAFGDTYGFFADGPDAERKAAVATWQQLIVDRPDIDV